MLELDDNRIKLIKEDGQVVVLNTHNHSWVKMSESFYNENGNKEQNKDNKLINVLNKFNILNCNENIDKTKNYFNSIYFAVTKKCNLSCEFCAMNSNPNISMDDDLNLDDIKNEVIPKLKEFNPRKILITGGEPIIRKDIYSLIDILYNNFGAESIILQSNGLLLNQDIISRLAGKISKIEISIENIFENEKLYKSMIEKINMLKDNEINISFSFVVDNDNKIYLNKAMDLTINYNAEFLLRLLAPAGEAIDNNLQYMDERDILLLYRDLINLIIEKGYENTHLSNLIYSYILPKTSCGAYGNVLSIYPDGELFMCPNLCNNTFNLGNIVKDSSENILSNLENRLNDQYIKDSLIVDHFSECKDCNYKYFCTGICKSLKNNAPDDKFIENRCNISKLLIKFILFKCDSKKDNLYNLNLALDYINHSIHKLESRNCVEV